jgi:hypothetical protein
MHRSGLMQRRATGCRRAHCPGALAVLGAVSSWCYSVRTLGHRWQNGLVGWFAVAVVVVDTSLLPRPAVLASSGVTTIGDVVTGDYFGQLRRWLAMIRGKVQPCECLPVSGAVFSFPANSRRLEIEGSEGFFSSAGGDGGDCGRCCCRYCCSSCCVGRGCGCGGGGACTVYEEAAMPVMEYPRGCGCW